VALGAFAAASIAGASALNTGFKAMRLGSIIYFIPFFFVLEPALIMEGSWGQTLFATLKVMVGIVLIAAALQHYLIGVGMLAAKGPVAMFGRLLMVIGGGLIALPTTEVIGLNIGQATLLPIGAVAAVIGVVLCRGVVVLAEVAEEAA